jgi:hypothetical protein
VPVAWYDSYPLYWVQLCQRVDRDILTCEQPASPEEPWAAVAEAVPRLLAEAEWDAGEILPDLSTMTACLAQIGAIVLDAGRDYLEEDCSIRPKYRTLAAVRLQELLGSKVQSRKRKPYLGYWVGAVRVAGERT